MIGLTTLGILCTPTTLFLIAIIIASIIVGISCAWVCVGAPLGALFPFAENLHLNTWQK